MRSYYPPHFCHISSGESDIYKKVDLFVWTMLCRMSCQFAIEKLNKKKWIRRVRSSKSYLLLTKSRIFFYIAAHSHSLSFISWAEQRFSACKIFHTYNFIHLFELPYEFNSLNKFYVACAFFFRIYRCLIIFFVLMTDDALNLLLSILELQMNVMYLNNVVSCTLDHTWESWHDSCLLCCR